MEKLEKLVDELIDLTDEKKIVEKLQEINETFLTEYEIKIGRYTIYPLRTEIYYYNDTAFKDINIHHKKENGVEVYGKKEQKGRFGKLYIHAGYSGVDICLSNDESYALSVLIKNSKVADDNETFMKQYAIADLCKQEGIDYAYDEKVIKKRDCSPYKEYYRSPRKGLTKDTYKTDELAALVEIIEHTGHKESPKNFDFVTGYGKTVLLKNPIKKDTK